MTPCACARGRLPAPFRDAVDVTIVGGGDRKGYQQDWRNGREALREIDADIAQGADMVMVKPALAYLDVIKAARARVDVPIAAYHVSGEYAMIKAAAANGWIDGDAVALEHLTAIKRAGADVILTYLARWFAEGPGARDGDGGLVPFCDPACADAGCDPVVCTGRGVPSNDALFARSERAIPGGVNSSIRAFRSVGGRPYVVARAEGPYVWDVEGTRYIDLVQSYGAVILGHAHPAITRALLAAAPDGTSYGAPTPREMKLAEEIADARAELRAGAADELGHRGDEHGRPPGPRVHRPRPADHVPRQLPRRHRRAARRRRQRGGHARAAGHGRGAGRRRRRDDGRAVQRGADDRRRRGRGHRRAGRRQHGRHRAPAGVPRGAA